MITAVIISILIMMIFAAPIGKFVNNNPTIQMLALSFLLLIGFMLITESAYLSNAIIFGRDVGSIPKGYLYFAIAFSLGVEALNMKMRKKKYHKNVSVLLTDETYDLLVKVTDALEKPLSEYLREMIEDNLCKIKKEGRIE